MARPEASVLEIKVEGSQLEFLENKAKELGISKEELVKSYIAEAIDEEHLHKKLEKGQFSLIGLARDGRVTDEDIEEVISEWSKSELA